MIDKFTKIGEILFDLYCCAYSRGYDNIYNPDEEAEIIKEYLNSIINLEGIK